jgi:hypothetical protein
MLAEPVAGTLRSIEQTRDALAGAMQVAALVSDGAISDELPKPAGMPMLDVSEISKKIVIEKPTVLSLLGKGMLTAHVRRKLEREYDRVLLDFLNLCANRLRRWMEQSINALRNGFAAFADMHRAQFENAPASGSPDISAVQNDLRILREWEAVNQDARPVIGRT